MAGVLLEAAAAGDVAAVRRLVEEGCDLEEADAEGDSAVLHAARGGHVEVLNVLLFAGANTRHANMEGTTALLEACQCGHLEAVRFLVEQTRYPDVGRTDVAGRGALICAASKGHAAVVRYLIGHQYADLGQADAAGMTALLWAARRGRLGLVRYLVDEAGVRLLQADSSHWTALLWAAYAGHLEVVEYLVSEKNARQRQRSREGFTALHCAALAGRTEVARYLLDFCPEPEQETKDGSTALLLAASKGRLETARMLLFERGANLHHRNAAGRSALDVARRKGHTAMAELLVLCAAEDTSDGAWRRLPLGHDLSDAVRTEVEAAARAGCLAALWLLYCNGCGLAASRHVGQAELLLMCRAGGHPTAVLTAALGEEDPGAMLAHVKEARRLAAAFSFLDNAQRSFHSATEKRVLSECRFRLHAKLRREGRQVGTAPSQEVLVEMLLRVTADDTLSSQVRLVRDTLTARREGASPAFHSLYYDIMTVMDLVRPLSELQAPTQTSKGSLTAEESVEAISKQLSRVASLLEPPELEPIVIGGEDSPEEGEEDGGPSAVEELGEEARAALAVAVRAVLKHYRARKEGGARKEARVYTFSSRWRRISAAAARKLTAVAQGGAMPPPGSGLRFHEVVYERPRAPGVEFAFAALHNELSGLQLLPSCLFVAEQGGARQVMVARPTSGFSLQFLLESHRDLLSRIDGESFGALVLTTLLAPPSNSNWANTAVSLEGDAVRLVATGGSDMGVGDRRVHVHQPGTARQGQPYVRSRCALWFLPQMHDALHPALRSRILSTSPEETLLSWLAQMEQQHGLYEQLINDEALSASDYRRLGLPIRCKRGLVPGALLQLHKARAALQENSQATPWDLFELLAPSLAEYYADVQRKVEASLRPAGWVLARGDSKEEEEEEEATAVVGAQEERFDAELLLACCFETYKDSAPSVELLQELADNTYDPSAAMAAIAEATHAPSSEQLISLAEAAEELLEHSEGKLLEDCQQEGVLRCLQALSCLRRLHFRNYRRLEDVSLQGLLQRAKGYSIAGVKRLRLAGETSLTVGALRTILSEYPLLQVELVHEHCTPPLLDAETIGGLHLGRPEEGDVSEVEEASLVGEYGVPLLMESTEDLRLEVDFSSAPVLEGLEAASHERGAGSGAEENGEEECNGVCSTDGEGGEREDQGKSEGVEQDAAEEGTEPTANTTTDEGSGGLEVDFSTAPHLEGLDDPSSQASHCEALENEAAHAPGDSEAAQHSSEEAAMEEATAEAMEEATEEATDMAIEEATAEAKEDMAEQLDDEKDPALEKAECQEQKAAVAHTSVEEEAAQQPSPKAAAAEATEAQAEEGSPAEATATEEEVAQEAEATAEEGGPDAASGAEKDAEECPHAEHGPPLTPSDAPGTAEATAAEAAAAEVAAAKAAATVAEAAAAEAAAAEAAAEAAAAEAAATDVAAAAAAAVALSCDDDGSAAPVEAAEVLGGEVRLHAEAMAAQELLLLLHELEGRAVLALGPTQLSAAALRQPQHLPPLVRQGEVDLWALQLFAAAATRPWRQEATDALAAAVAGGHAPLAAALLAATPATAELLAAAVAARRGACAAVLLEAGALPSDVDAALVQAMAEPPAASATPELHALLEEIHCQEVEEALLRAAVADVQALRLVPCPALLAQVAGVPRAAARCLLARAARLPPPPRAAGQSYERHALVVAVASERMRYAEADGTRLALGLQAHGFATTLLAGAAASKETVLDARWRLLQAPSEAGVRRGVAVVFIGEGWQQGQTMWLRLAGFDARHAASTGIDVASWVHAANDSDAHHVLSVLDYWGAGADRCIGLVDAAPSLSQGPPLEERQEVLARPGRCLLTAALPADERPELLHAPQSGTVASALLQLLCDGDASLGRRWMTSEELAAGTYRLLRAVDCPCQIYVATQGEGSLVFDT